MGRMDNFAAADSDTRSSEPLVDALDAPRARLVSKAARDLYATIVGHKADWSTLDEYGPAAAAGEAETILFEALDLDGQSTFHKYPGREWCGWYIKARGEVVDLELWRDGEEPVAGFELTPVAAIALAERVLLHDGG